MFNEQDTEFSKKQNKEIPVFQSAKYIEAKMKALELIESKKYNLSEADFWILMNETKSGKMMYSGLIISHNGCLKINDHLEDKLKFKPSCVSLDKEGYAGTLVYTYINDEQGIYEVGEVAQGNCKNDYPYAMALKRCMDRVILKNCKLAYSGVYSDAEADEFAQKDTSNVVDSNEGITEEQEQVLLGLFETYEAKVKKYTKDDLVEHTLEKYKIDDLRHLSIKDYTDVLKKMKTDLGGK